MYQKLLYKRKQLSAIGLLAAAVSSVVAALGQPAQATDWMTWPSTYTHDRVGARVDQHTESVKPLGPNRNDVVRSGFRHFRSTLQAGQSADNYHVTEQWGAPVVPYEHWRFPFRPFGVPYDAWGPPTPYGMFFGAGLGFPQWPPHFQQGISGPGIGGPGWSGSQRQSPWQGHGGWGFPLQPNYQHQPWFDGTHPDSPPLDNRSDREFFWKPVR